MNQIPPNPEPTPTDGQLQQGLPTKPWSGQELYNLIERLFPINRSITGDGVRSTLSILQTHIPIEVVETPTGTAVLDWTVPDEWNLSEGYIENAAGQRLIDTANSNLHVVNYSHPIAETLTRDALEPHLHSLPNQPDAIPYRTSYYQRTWGFCLSEVQRASLGSGPFRVVVDATLEPGSLSYGELLIQGEQRTEMLVSTHICHPSLANDNLSGIALATALASHLLSGKKPKLSWRFIFVPGTIGAITWLAANKGSTDTIKGGLVLTGLGDDSSFTWKEPRENNTWINQVVSNILNQSHGKTHKIVPFSPYGYDERQYGSPGFNLPIGRLTRAIHGTFPEYHTSLDNLKFVNADRLEESLVLLEGIADACNSDYYYINQSPYGEPQLGKRGLYGSLGALNTPGDLQMAMLWLLNLSDGEHSLSDISIKSGISQNVLADIASVLLDHDLLERRQHRTENPQ